MSIRDASRLRSSAGALRHTDVAERARRSRYRRMAAFPTLRRPPAAVNVQSFRHSRGGVSNFRRKREISTSTAPRIRPRVASTDTENARDFARHPDTDAALTPPRRSPTLSSPIRVPASGGVDRSCEGKSVWTTRRSVNGCGGYSHLLDVLADANDSLLRPLGIYFELSGSEAAAAALLGASINYPIRGAVTWKSVVGTNVASDALSHVASAGVLGGALVVIGEDYGEGASILQERTHSAALKSSVPLLDPRNTLQSFARFVEEGFGLSEACNEPVFFSIRIRACHMRGTLACRDNVRPAISMRSPLEAPSFSLERINLPPFTYAMEAKKFEQRLPAARRYILERGLNEHRPGTESHLGIVMQGGLWNTTVRGLHLLGLADVHGRTPVPLMILNAIHPLVPEELLGFLRGKKRVLVVEEGMPNHLERELKALAHEAKLDVEIQGKEVFSPHGEYVPALVIGGLRKFLVGANPTAQSVTAIEDRYAALPADRATVRAALPEPVSKRPPSFCTGCPERPLFSAMKILRTQEPSIGDTHVAADIGCHTFSTQAPFHVGNSVLGYGMGLASSSAVAPLFGKRVMSV